MMMVMTVGGKAWCFIQDNRMKALRGCLSMSHVRMAVPLQVMALCNKHWRRIPDKRLLTLWGWLPFSPALMATLHVMTLLTRLWCCIPDTRPGADGRNKGNDAR